MTPNYGFASRKTSIINSTKNLALVATATSILYIPPIYDRIAKVSEKIVASFNSEDSAPRVQDGDFCYVDGAVDGTPDETTGEC